MFYRHFSVAPADFDQDGDVDLFFKNGIGRHDGFAELYTNDGTSNHYLSLQLQGTDSNRDGIGAQVEVRTNTTTQTQQNYLGNGGTLYSQSAMPLHFNAGTDTQAEVTVLWPNDTYQSISAVAADQALTIVQPQIDFVIDGYTAEKVPQQNQYVLTITGTGLDNVLGFSLEANNVVRDNTIELTLISSTELEVTFRTDPTQVLEAPLDVFFTNASGVTAIERDALLIQSNPYAVELADGVTGFEDVVYATAGGDPDE